MPGLFQRASSSRSGSGVSRVSETRTSTVPIPSLGQSNASPDQGAVGGSVGLGDRAITSSAFGAPRQRGFGTIRQAGNIIWARPIDQQENEAVQSSGGVAASRQGNLAPVSRVDSIRSTSTRSGVGRVSQVAAPLLGGVQQVVSGSVLSAEKKTYSNYATFAVAFGEGPAESLLRLWADGNLIYDRGGEKLDVEPEGLVYRFYTGSEDQLPDPSIVADKGEDDTPAFRGTCYIVFDALPLDAFNNRVPNITAEIVYSQDSLRPVIGSIPLAGSITTVEGGYFCIDWKRGFAYCAVRNEGIRRVNMLSGLEDRQVLFSDIMEDEDQGVNGLFAPSMAVMGDGSIVLNAEGGNGSPQIRLHPDTLQQTSSFGFAGLQLSNNGSRFTNSPHIVAVSLRTGDGESEHYALTGAFGERKSFGLLKMPDMDFVWHNNLPSDQMPLGADFLGMVQGAVVDGIGEAWILTGTEYSGGANSDDLHLYRIQVLEGARYNSVDNIAAGVIVSLESTFTVDDLSPGSTTLSHVGDLIYDQVDDGILMAVTGDVGGRRYVKYRPATGAIDWRTNTLSSLPGPQIGLSQLKGTTLGWLTADGEGVLIDTTTGAVLMNHDSPNWDPEPLGSTGAYDSRTSSFIGQLAMDDDGEPIGRYLMNRGSSTEATLASVILAVGDLTDLDTGDLDVSNVNDISVPGYIINSQSTAREAIETLTSLYLVDMVESDFKLEFRKRGSASARTIEQRDLAPLETRDGTSLTQSRIQEVELPERYTITYLDSENDYIQQSNSAKRILSPNPAMSSHNKLGVDVPVAMTSTTAKRQAELTLFSAWAERDMYQARFSWRHLDLDPTDVVTIELDNGDTYRARLDQMDISATLTVDADLIGEQIMHTPTVLADSGERIRQVIKSISAVKTFLLDVPLLGDLLNPVDRSYTVIHTLQASYADDQFTRAIVQRRSGNQFENVSVTHTGAEWGIIVEALPDPPFNNPFATDMESELKVRMVAGSSSLETITRETLLSHPGENRAAILKTNGEVEIIQFQNVVEESDGSFTLSTLLRGQRGTDAMTNDHTVGEIFLLLIRSGGTFNLPLSDHNVAAEYRGVGGGQLMQDGEQIELTSMHRSLMPYAPTNVQAVLDASDNIDLTWDRRDRVGGGIFDGTDDVILSEDTEEYEIDILDGPDGSVVRTVTGVTSESYGYPNADVLTDFESVPSRISLRVYQISAQVGRGFTREVTVDVQ